MILPLEQVKDRGVVRKFISKEQLQQCGIDLTLRDVFSFSSPGRIGLHNKDRKISDVKRMKFRNGEVFLPRGAYKIVYNEYVRIPDDCAGIGFPRSSLLRCGAFVHCALWDPGYEGRSESLLVVENEKGIVLKKDARIVQLSIILLSERAKRLYSGAYKGENR